MNKLFSKLGTLLLGASLVVAGGVAVSSKKAGEANAAPGTIMTFDFEENDAHRTSGSNNYTSENTYSQHGVTIKSMYADSVTSGSPLVDSANILARVAKNTTNSPYLLIGPVDLSSYKVTGFSYVAKSPKAFTFTASYSTDGSSWTQAETHTNTAVQDTFSSSALEIMEPSAFYLKIVISVGASTGSNRDGQIDDVKIIGESTGTTPLTKIECDDAAVGVTSKANLANGITYTPNDAANKNVSFAIKSGNDLIDLTAEGVVTGKKGGNAVVTITPEDTNASPIDVNITVNSISEPAITVGDQYVIYSIDETNGNFEMTGLSGGLGTSASFNGDTPSCLYVLDTEEGYYENTVAFKNGTKYLALTSASNNIHQETSISANSSWIVEYDSGTNAAVIRNAVFDGRTIQHNYNSGSPRFACYATGGQTAICLYHFVDSPLENFTFDEAEMSVYVSEKANVAVTYTPASASDKALSWLSENDAIATVDDSGKVTGVAVGDTTVTATKVIDEFNVERTITVHVLSNIAAHEGTQADPFDVADAVNVAKGIFTKVHSGAAVDLTNGEYYVSGILTKLQTGTTSNLSFWLGDNASQISAATGGFEVYRAASVYGTELATKYASENEVKADFVVGAHVLVKGKLTFYTSSSTPETVQNTADVVWSSYIEARTYAQAFNTAMEAVCSDEERTVSSIAAAWATQASNYPTDALVKAHFTEAEAKTTSGATDVEKCVAKYDFIAGKYQDQLGENYDFMGRNPEPIASGAYIPNYQSNIDSSSSITIIVIVAVTSMTLLGVTLVLRKRKHQ